MVYNGTGWLKLHRRIFAKDHWTGDNHKYKYWLIYLNTIASTNDNYIHNRNGLKIPLNRGCCFFRKGDLANQFKEKGKVKADTKSVDRFIDLAIRHKEFEKIGSKPNYGIKIKLLNYKVEQPNNSNEDVIF